MCLVGFYQQPVQLSHDVDPSWLDLLVEPFFKCYHMILIPDSCIVRILLHTTPVQSQRILLRSYRGSIVLIVHSCISLPPSLLHFFFFLSSILSFFLKTQQQQKLFLPSAREMRQRKEGEEGEGGERTKRRKSKCCISYRYTTSRSSFLYTEHIFAALKSRLHSKQQQSVCNSKSVSARSPHTACSRL